MIYLPNLGVEKIFSAGFFGRDIIVKILFALAELVALLLVPLPHRIALDQPIVRVDGVDVAREHVRHLSRVHQKSSIAKLGSSQLGAHRRPLAPGR